MTVPTGDRQLPPQLRLRGHAAARVGGADLQRHALHRHAARRPLRRRRGAGPARRGHHGVLRPSGSRPATGRRRLRSGPRLAARGTSSQTLARSPVIRDVAHSERAQTLLRPRRSSAADSFFSRGLAAGPRTRRGPRAPAAHTRSWRRRPRRRGVKRRRPTPSRDRGRSRSQPARTSPPASNAGTSAQRISSRRPRAPRASASPKREGSRGVPRTTSSGEPSGSRRPLRMP